MINKIENVRNLFKSKLLNEVFTIDKTGQKTIEWIGASFLADEPSIFGEPNQDYIDRELNWYRSQVANVNAISGKVPVAWKLAANDWGEVNSNYGQIIYSDKYHHQYG